MKKVILLLLFIVPLFCQDYFKLYENEIPNNFKQGFIKNSVKLNVEKYCKISPVILSYYIERLILSADQLKKENYKKSNNNFYAILKSEIKLKNEWLEKIKKKSSSDLINKAFKDKVIHLLDEFENIDNMEIEEQAFERDINKEKYYILKSIKDDVSLTFNENKDYNFEFENTRAIVIKEFENKCKHSKNNFETYENDLKWIIENYAFISSHIDNVESIASLINNMHKAYIDYEKSFGKFELFIGYTHNLLNSVDYNLKVGGNTITEQDFPICKNTFGVGINYKIKLKPELKAFSYLVIGAMFQFSLGENKHEMDNSLSKLPDYNGGKQIDYVTYLGDEKVIISNSKNLDIILSIPILFVNKKLKVEVGLLSTFSVYDKELKYRYSLKKYIRDDQGKYGDVNRPFVSILYSDSVDESKKGAFNFDFRPIIQLHFQISRLMFLKANLTWEYYGLNIGRSI